MKIRIINSKDEVPLLDQNETIIHIAFRPSNQDLLDIIENCPRIRAIQIPSSYYKCASKAARQLLKMWNIKLLEGTVWGYRTDIYKHYEIEENVIEQIREMFYKGEKVETIMKHFWEERKLSPDLIWYITDTNTRN